MLTLSVAVDENTRQAEQRSEVETTWCRVVVWEELADQMSTQLHQGSLVYIEGRLRLDRWTAQDGMQRSGLSCSAWLVQAMGQIGRQRPQQSCSDGRQPVVAGGARREELGEMPF
jgi:single-strand DNA-binding protein